MHSLASYTDKNPLSDGEKVGIAIGILAILGIGGYFLYKSSQTASNATGAAFPTGSMQQAGNGNSGTQMTTACAPGTTVYLYDTAGNKYTASISSCQSPTQNAGTTTGQTFVTIAIAASGVPAGATALTPNTYVNVPWAYLSSN